MMSTAIDEQAPRQSEAATKILARALSDTLPLDQRRYVVLERSGRYLVAAKRTEWQTVKWVYTWTEDFAKARVFTFSEIAEKGPEALSAKEQDKSLLVNLTTGYAGVRLVRIR